VFSEPVANGLGTVKDLIVSINISRLSSASVHVSCLQFSITIAIGQSRCNILCKENAVNGESYQWWFAPLREEGSVGFYSVFLNS
jgi:hypothetical protein